VYPTSGSQEDMACPRLSRLFIEKPNHVAKALLGITPTEPIADLVPTLLWIWDKRRTKVHTEGISVQEARIHVVGLPRELLEDKVATSLITEEVKEWNIRLHDFTQLVEALNIEVDIADYPQVADRGAITVHHWGRRDETSGTETIVTGETSPTRDVAAIRPHPPRPPTRRTDPN